MANPYNKAIEYWKTVIAGIAGADYSWDVIRPPYSTGDNSGVTVASGISLFCEPAGPNWAQDKIPDAEFYSVCGDHSLFQSGDILDSGADIPLVTVFSDADSQEFLAIKTDKTCTIKDIGRQWSNLRFDYMNSTSAGPDEFRDDNTALNNPVRRIIMYAVPGITEGMKLFDDSTGMIWDISRIDTKFSLMTVFLDQVNRT